MPHYINIYFIFTYLLNVAVQSLAVTAAVHAKFTALSIISHTSHATYAYAVHNGQFNGLYSSLYTTIISVYIHTGRRAVVSIVYGRFQPWRCSIV